MVIYLVVDDARNIYLMHWMTMCTEGDKRNVCTTVAGWWINVLNQRLPNAFIWQSAFTTSMKHQTFCSRHISLRYIFIQGIKSERTFFQKSILRCKKFWPQSIFPLIIRIPLRSRNIITAFEDCLPISQIGFVIFPTFWFVGFTSWSQDVSIKNARMCLPHLATRGLRLRSSVRGRSTDWALPHRQRGKEGGTLDGWMDGSLLSHPALPPHPTLMDWQLSASILCVVPCPMNALSIPSIEDIVPGVEDQNRWVCTVRHFPSAVHIIRMRSIKLACVLEKH